MINQIIRKFKQQLKGKSTIVITTHTSPDADGIGSQVALSMALEKLGKKTFCVNEETLNSRYHYLDKNRRIQSFRQAKGLNQKSIDLLIVVDANSTDRIGEQMKKLAVTCREILFIDHHPCATEVIDLHCIDTSAAATGQLMSSIIKGLGIDFDQEMALALYTAIMIDTSSFRYPTVDEKTHYIIGDLLATGIRPHDAYNKIYGAKKLDHMRLLGKVLSDSQAVMNGEIAWIKITDNMLEKYNVSSDDTHSFVNHLLILDKVKVACMFRSYGGQVKISLRSTGIVDVGTMAQAIGGGGHDHSAATIIDGPIDQVIKDTVKKLQRMLKLKQMDQE